MYASSITPMARPVHASSSTVDMYTGLAMGIAVEEKGRQSDNSTCGYTSFKVLSLVVVSSTTI